MNVIQLVFPALRRMKPSTGQENRWLPRLSGIFKEDCRRGLESNNPTIQPRVISILPPWPSESDTLTFNVNFKLQCSQLGLLENSSAFSLIAALADNCDFILMHLLLSLCQITQPYRGLVTHPASPLEAVRPVIGAMELLPDR